MINTEDNREKMWEIFAKTGRPDDYVRYAQYTSDTAQKGENVPQTVTGAVNIDKTANQAEG